MIAAAQVLKFADPTAQTAFPVAQMRVEKMRLAVEVAELSLKLSTATQVVTVQMGRSTAVDADQEHFSPALEAAKLASVLYRS